MYEQEFNLDRETIKRLGYLIVDQIAEEFSNPANRPIFPPKQSKTTIEATFGGELPRQGTPAEQLLDQVMQDVLPTAGNPNHPNMMINVLSGSLPLPALIQALSAAVKLRPSTWKAQPASCHIEATVVRWIGQMIGYADDAAGYLTTGGSIANLMGIAMGRVHKAGWDIRQEGMGGRPHLVVYVSEQAHSSIEKGIQILGIGSQFLCKIPVDANNRMRLDVLEAAVARDVAAGHKPFCLIGNAGTTSTGAVDPLDKLADLAEQHNLWFHVDAAYGGFAALDPAVSHLFRGIERADSVTVDPHKWLNVPFEAGGILTKSWDTLRDTFHLTPPYIRGMMGREHNQWDYGFELGRTDRALKVWIALKQYGVDQFSEMIVNHNRLACYLAELIDASDHFEVVSPPVLSICCFRYVPKDFERGTPESDAYLSQLNTAIEQALVEDGRALVSGTNLHGSRVLRACIVSSAVTHNSITETMKLLEQYAPQLDAQMRPALLQQNR